MKKNIVLAALTLALAGCAHGYYATPPRGPVYSDPVVVDGSVEGWYDAPRPESTPWSTGEEWYPAPATPIPAEDGWAFEGEDVVVVNNWTIETTVIEYWSDDSGASYAGHYYPGAVFVPGPWVDEWFPYDGCHVPGGVLLHVDRPHDHRIPWRAYHGHRGHRTTGYVELRDAPHRHDRDHRGRFEIRPRGTSDRFDRSRDEAARAARERTERENRERAGREAAARENERKAREESERTARETRERTARDAAARERTGRQDRERAERDARERAGREATARENERKAREETERTARETRERTARDAAVRERTERENRERAGREAAASNAERKAREKADREAREEAERLAKEAEKAARDAERTARKGGNSRGSGRR
ncbi:MAG: hypothetical protein MUE73_11265 [Planctomycetes bacterium]|nr:hypothetical protein [Planctomycetota bacterium]